MDAMFALTKTQITVYAGTRSVKETFLFVEFDRQAENNKLRWVAPTPYHHVESNRSKVSD
jgi:hypothetical protein